MSWKPLASVSEGRVGPHTGITAVLIDGGGRVELFGADPGGGVYTAWGHPEVGWSGWHSVSEGSAGPNTRVTAIPIDGGRIELLLADPGGGVYTAWGHPEHGWSGWHSVSEGHAGPNTEVTAVRIDGGRIALFCTDPGGGVYTAWGHPEHGWSGWHSVSEGHAGPNTSVSAVRLDGGRVALFCADPAGGVYTAWGHPEHGWSGWHSVSEGAAGLNTSLAAVALGDNRIALFATDPSGAVYANVGHPEHGWGLWQWISEGRAALNTSVTAVAMGGGRVALFAIDPLGGVYTASGYPGGGWSGWSSVVGALAGLGSHVGAVPISGGKMAVFIPDPDGGVFATTGDSSSPIKHVFTLMLENRSFDHMLGFSHITGTDAATAQPTEIDGLLGNESNSFEGQTYAVSTGAPDLYRDGEGPGHEFEDVLEQLCGPGVSYPSGGPYPPINNSGYVSAYARKVGPELVPNVMKCYGPDQLPVLNALAREFVICDRWFSSMPGPTNPNRFFAYAGTSGQFDDSPSTAEIVESILFPDLGPLEELTGGSFGGFKFKNGSVFDLIEKAGLKYRIYADDHFPVAAELDGVSVVSDVREFEDLARDLQNPSFNASYIHIEPAYSVPSYAGGNSQHPGGRVSAGERFLKEVYETIRNSPVWDKSLLIVTYDEHGGFYDHVIPGPAPRTGEFGRDHGFTFDQLGPRVPAIIVSPLIPRNLIEHRTFDHTDIIATLCEVFNLRPLARRNGLSGGVAHLATLLEARIDAPFALPEVAIPADAPLLATDASFGTAPAHPDLLLSDEESESLTAPLHSALVQHLQVTPPAQHDAIRARFASLKTQADAFLYLREVERLVHEKRVQEGMVPADPPVPVA